MAGAISEELCVDSDLIALGLRVFDKQVDVVPVLRVWLFGFDSTDGFAASPHLKTNFVEQKRLSGWSARLSQWKVAY